MSHRDMMFVVAQNNIQRPECSVGANHEQCIGFAPTGQCVGVRYLSYKHLAPMEL